jgi:hypothetical protein
MLDNLLWASLVISVLTSLARAANIGFQRETYALTIVSLLPIIYDVAQTGSIQVILFNVFHLMVAIFGTYRWWSGGQAAKKHMREHMRDEEGGYNDHEDHEDHEKDD